MSKLKEKIITEIKKIYDPEIPVNIYELGLIYKIDISEENKVIIEMTLTSPNCPVAESLPNSVKENILNIEGINDVDLKLVWDPPWTKDKMPAIAPIKILKPKVNPRKIPVIDANKIETINVIPKIVNCNFVYSSL